MVKTITHSKAENNEGTSETTLMRSIVIMALAEIKRHF